VTDRGTDRQTDGRTGDGKERAIAYMLSRAKNVTKFIPTFQNRYVEMTSNMTSSKTQFTDKDGHLTKPFQKEKHDAASHLLKEYANRN